MALYAIMLDSEIEAHNSRHPVAMESEDCEALLALTEVSERCITTYLKNEYIAERCPGAKETEYLIMEESQYETGTVYELKKI